jgi:hypothetical protein
LKTTSRITPRPAACSASTSFTKLLLMGPTFRRRTIARMRTVETVRAVTPVVSQTSSLHARRHILFVKGYYRQ